MAIENEVNVQVKQTVKIDGKDYVVEDLPVVAKVAIDHLMAIDKESQRLEMARAGFAQAIKQVFEGPDAPTPVGEDVPTEPATGDVEVPPTVKLKTVN